ncbi:cell wall-binding repeat-containing protein [Leucobacter triazinivorans]|uniref:Cell wall-binding repeat-containing protein n=1 Tax=Leucobacter triazinivorans TaxID=1784719 RepID=A0A4P6KHF5_9MICO|nr:cell wall-binding repeat-containing protein [Leucobacter triazinivorans]QBE49428.1 cell wall-binding repeat-containing protein [Leucobacter triazinivorans]
MVASRLRSPGHRARLAAVGALLATAAALAGTLTPAAAFNRGEQPSQDAPAESTAPGSSDPEDPQPAAPTGDPLLEGMIEPDDTPVAANDARLALPGVPVTTDAVTATTIDPASGRAYAATRSASPARLYAADPTGEAATIAHDLPFGTGSWDMALSGTMLAVGTSAPTSQRSTQVLGFDTQTSTFTASAILPKSSIVMSIIEDTVLAAPDNGRWYWAGTYDAAGAKLFRVDLKTGNAIDYTPATSWRSFRYVRSLAADATGLTIGLGNPAAVWRLDRASQQLHMWSEATQALNGRSIAYSAAATSPADGSAPTVIIGSEAEASLFVGSPPGSDSPPARRLLLPVDGMTIDRIVIDTANARAWFTVRPEASLYSLDLDDPASTPVARGVPEPGSETRSLQVIDGMVQGVTGTSELWIFDPSTDSVLPGGKLIPADQELRDAIPQGVVEFGNRLLVGGHWRYQVHGDPSVQQVRIPGEPKAQVVVGDKLYSAIYPSASVYELDSSLNVSKVAMLGKGQMRPAAIAYSPGLDKLVVATGPTYGNYGGGVSLVSRAPGSIPEVFTAPVGRHQVSAIEPGDTDLFLGTSTIGEAQPALPNERARVLRWQADGDDETGTVVWSTTLPVQVTKVNGVHLTADESGRQLIVAADPTTGAQGWLFGLDPDTGAVLWKQQVEGPIRSMKGSQDYLAMYISSTIQQIGVSRSGAILTDIRDFGTSIVPSFISIPDTPSTTQRIAYVGAGANGIAGIAEQGTPRVPTRVAGVDRYATAVAVSRQTYGSASTVVLARGDDFADALSAGPLAAALDAPILLAKPDGRLTPDTVAEIARLGATKALPVGGTGAIPDAIAGELPPGVSLDPHRPQGSNRYETSVAVAERLEAELGGTPRDTFAATGRDFADAIAAVPAAVMTKRAIVLYDDTAAARTAKAYLEARSVDALGGPALTALRAAGLQPTRSIVGSDRFDTAEQIGLTYFGKTAYAYIAPGMDFPDGLAAGVLAGRTGSPLLLSRPTALTSPTTNALLNGRGSQRVTLVGGIGVLEPRLEQVIADLQ